MGGIYRKPDRMELIMRDYTVDYDGKRFSRTFDSVSGYVRYVIKSPISGSRFCGKISTLFNLTELTHPDFRLTVSRGLRAMRAAMRS
jgi:hypothetical protein